MAESCQYCGDQNISPTRCEACGRDFPWAAAFDEMKTLLKERETSRLRATTTLIEEAMASRNGGPPISLSAIKGFATSWLFPRTVIVIGSLVSVVLLGMQTYIINSQTKLLRQQAMAAQVEQAGRLTERVKKIDQMFESVERVRSNWKQVSYPNIYLLPCSPSSCPSDASLHAILKEPSTTRAQQSVMVEINRPLLGKLLFVPFSMGPFDIQYWQEVPTPLTKVFLEPSITECFTDHQTVEKFKSFYELRVQLKQAYEDGGDRARALVQIFHSVDLAWNNESPNINDMTYESFIDGMSEINKQIEGAWDIITKACVDTRDQSSKRILQIEKSLNSDD